MKECTAAGKPLVSIIMAVYNPNMDWLKEQLLSLNTQDYPNLELNVIDDCSDQIPFTEIQDCVKDCIAAFPFTIDRNPYNMGSNKTFEKLTLMAQGAYIAYCDQDDIWLSGKISVLMKAIKGATLAYSDMAVIGSRNEILADSLRDMRSRLCYRQGSDLAEYYFFQNCTAGCSMITDASVAKYAVPFPIGTVCDQWLCIICALQGTVRFVDSPLMRYRQHANNQTGIFSGISTKQDYYRKRVETLAERLSFYRRYSLPSQSMIQFVEARMKKNMFAIWRERKFCIKDAKFEIALKFMPEFIFKKVVALIRGK